jgi:hypothetical protein
MFKKAWPKLKRLVVAAAGLETVEALMSEAIEAARLVKR